MYVFNNPVLRVDPHGLESGNLNTLVPGPNGEIATNAPCPRCIDRTLQEIQKMLGKPGCVAECAILGFADDVPAVGVGLLSKTVRAWLRGAGGKVFLKAAGLCGLGAAAIFCSYHCDVLAPPPPPKPGFNPHDPYTQYALTHQ